MTARAPGRYCLRICYCGGCPHWEPYELTDQERRALLAYLARGRRYTNNAISAAWIAEPPGKR